MGEYGREFWPICLQTQLAEAQLPQLVTNWGSSLLAVGGSKFGCNFVNQIGPSISVMSLPFEVYCAKHLKGSLASVHRSFAEIGNLK